MASLYAPIPQSPFLRWFVTTFLLVVCLCGGLAWMDAVPWKTAALVAVCGGAVGSFLVALERTHAHAQKRNRYVLQHGIPAQAMVLKVEKVESRENDVPRLHLRVNVLPPDGAPYEASLAIGVPPHVADACKVGSLLPIKIHPRDPSVLVVMPLLGNEPALGQTEADIEKSLVQIDQDNEAIRQTGESTKAKVLAFSALGVLVNGNNPAVRLEVEVYPQGREPFRTTVQGVIHEASILKFQPGKEILVAFDPARPSRAAIVRSI